MRRQMLRAGYRGAMIAAMLGACTPARAPAGEAKPETATSAIAPASAAVEPAPPELQSTSPAVYRGSALARQVCVQCHDIGVPGTRPAADVGAPAFVEVANREDMSMDYLSQWMRSSHPSMPGFLFDDASVADLSAYLMAFRKPD